MINISYFWSSCDSIILLVAIALNLLLLVVSRSFESTPEDEISVDREAEPQEVNRVLTFSESVQTVGIVVSTVETQTAGDYKRILPEYSVEYFKKIVESNSELHRRDVLIEARRLALTRVVGIISLKISFRLNHFIHKSGIKRLERLFYLNFVRILSRVVRYRLLFLLRIFVRLLELRLRKVVEIPPKLLLSDPRNATPRDVLRLDLSCLYMCKVVTVVFMLRKSRYLNLVYRYCPKNRYVTRIFKPINNVVQPLDFFLSS